ncbi:AMP-binding protein [Celerinatantimonas yamalensis]|uniref:AMP-binding protein n=1 Tax=Celerinatantimonas yamalensis TaxID=559956 RepID=A0ABW9G496_9GAMM
MDKINQWLNHGATQYPDRIALEGDWLDGGYQALSYAQLEERVARTTSELVKRQIRCVLLRADNSLNWAIADLSAMRAGIVLVPVPTFFSAKQISYLAKSCQADGYWGDWPEQMHATTYLMDMPLYCQRVTDTVVFPRDTQKITFTSGSTGDPKGVCLSRQAQADVAESLASRLSANQQNLSCHMALLPLSVLLENICALYVPFALGASCVIRRSQHVGLFGSSRFDAAIFSQALRQHQPHSLVVTPALLGALVQLTSHSMAPFSQLQFIALGGARVSQRLLAQAEQLGLPVYQGYGLSEAASVVSFNTPQANRIGSVGQALEHRQLRIDEQGHLWVRGSLMQGYLGQPELGEQWLDTGDLAHQDAQGYLYIEGRASNLLITSFGRNISPEWLESEAQIWPLLQQLVVFGDGGAQLEAVVLLKQPSSDEMAEKMLDELQQSVQSFNQQLPDYARLYHIYWCWQHNPMLSDWRTSNGRWRRQHIQTWLVSRGWQPILTVNDAVSVVPLHQLDAANTISSTGVDCHE